MRDLLVVPPTGLAVGLTRGDARTRRASAGRYGRNSGRFAPSGPRSSAVRQWVPRSPPINGGDSAESNNRSDARGDATPLSVMGIPDTAARCKPATLQMPSEMGSTRAPSPAALRLRAEGLDDVLFGRAQDSQHPVGIADVVPYANVRAVLVVALLLEYLDDGHHGPNLNVLVVAVVLFQRLHLL